MVSYVTQAMYMVAYWGHGIMSDDNTIDAQTKAAPTRQKSNSKICVTDCQTPTNSMTCIYTTFTNLSMKYLMMCKVYMDLCGIK